MLISILRIFLILYLTSLDNIICKTISKAVFMKTFQVNRWRYLTKFGFNQGNNLIQMRAKFKSSTHEIQMQEQFYEVKIGIYNQDSYHSLELNPDMECHYKSAASLKDIILRIPLNGDFSQIVESSIKIEQNGQMMFLAIRDCDKNFEKIHLNDQGPKITKGIENVFLYNTLQIDITLKNGIFKIQVLKQFSKLKILCKQTQITNLKGCYNKKIIFMNYICTIQNLFQVCVFKKQFAIVFKWISSSSYDQLFHQLFKENSHFGAELDGMLYPLFFISGGLISFFIYNHERYLKDYQNQEQNDYILILVNISLFSLFLGVFCEFIQLLIYDINGSGFFLFSFFHLIFEQFSQFLFTCILILLSWGWTITFSDLENECELLLPLIIFLGVLQIMIGGISKITDDDFNKFHNYEGLFGYFLIIIRLGMMIYYKYGIIETKKNQKQKIKDFLFQLDHLGTLYFLSLPFLIIQALFIEPYQRHKFIFIGNLCIQIVSIVIISKVLTSKQSSYYQASYKGQAALDFKGE